MLKLQTQATFILISSEVAREAFDVIVATLVNGGRITEASLASQTHNNQDSFRAPGQTSHPSKRLNAAITHDVQRLAAYQASLSTAGSPPERDNEKL